MQSELSSSSFNSVTIAKRDLAALEDAAPSSPLPHSQLQPIEAYKQPQPSIRLLYSFLTRHDFLLLVLPALCFSIVSGGVAPFMTVVVGDVFNSFADFPISAATDDQKHALLHGVGISALELLALAVGAIALSSVTSALWISTGERNVMRLRSQVYKAVSTRDMEWFDTKMGSEDGTIGAEGDGPVGAGGLMAKFNRCVCIP